MITNKDATSVVDNYKKYVNEFVNLVVVQTVNTNNENNYIIVKDNLKFNDGNIIIGEFYYNTPTFDFGNARNYAKMLVLSFGGWVLSLDDDDEIDISSEMYHRFFNDLNEKLNETNYDAFYVNYRMWIGNINQFDTKAVRLFRNLPNIVWRDSIHESVNFSLEFNGFKICKMDEPILTLNHSGYKDVKMLYFKAKRNIECYLNNPYLLDRFEHLEKFIDTTKRKKDLENQFNYSDIMKTNVELIVNK